MDFLELVTKNRAYRRFEEMRSIPEQQLIELIEYARRSASGANLQPLRFHLNNTKDKNDEIFPTLKWAGYLSDWDGPEEGQRPAAYITIARDTEVKDLTSSTDAGIAIQSILLGAVNMGYGGCVIASIDREKLRRILNIEERYEILYVLALGVPAEEATIETIRHGQSIEYYRDEKDLHHVPKLIVDDLLI